MNDYLKADAKCPHGCQPLFGTLRILSWECGHCGGKWMAKPDEVLLIAEFKRERDALRATIEEFAQFCADSGWLSVAEELRRRAKEARG